MTSPSIYFVPTKDNNNNNEKKTKREKNGKSFLAILLRILVHLPWFILIISAVQIAVHYLFDTDNSASALSLPSPSYVESSPSVSGSGGNYTRASVGHFLRTYARFFSYMFTHFGDAHLWSNVAMQVTWGLFASAGGHRTGGDIAGTLEVALVYLLAVFGGGVAFRSRHAALGSMSDVDGLVGSSAGGFGLAGLALLDTGVDGVGLVRRKCKMGPFSWVPLVVAVVRSFATPVLLFYDLFGLGSDDLDRKDTILVHLAGVASGLLVATFVRAFKAVVRLAKEERKKKRKELAFALEEGSQDSLIES